MLGFFDVITLLDSYSPKNYEIDHIIPISLAKTENDVIRLNQLNNLRLICKNCNRNKRDKIINIENK